MKTWRKVFYIIFGLFVIVDIWFLHLMKEPASGSIILVIVLVLIYTNDLDKDVIKDLSLRLEKLEGKIK